MNVSQDWYLVGGKINSYLINMMSDISSVFCLILLKSLKTCMQHFYLYHTMLFLDDLKQTNNWVRVSKTRV
jgi:hypothetical protein